MAHFEENPFAASTVVSESVPSDPKALELADRSKRLVAAIADGLLLMAFVFPIQYFSGYIGRVQRRQVSFAEVLLASALSILIHFCLNGFFLAKRGQSIGKMLTAVQIVDHQTNKLLPLSRSYVVRFLWSLPLSLVYSFIYSYFPSLFMTILFDLVIFGDVLMIFRSDRRCLHDLLAGSKVVPYVMK